MKNPSIKINLPNHKDVLQQTRCCQPLFLQHVGCKFNLSDMNMAPIRHRENKGFYERCCLFSSYFNLGLLMNQVAAK